MSFQFDCFLVIPHASRSRVLLVRDGLACMLPHFVFTEDHFGIVDHVNRAALERLGLSLTVRRCLFYDCQPDHIQAIYLMETHTAVEPTMGQWVRWEDAASLPLKPIEHRPYATSFAVESVMAQDKTPLPVFTYPGWYDATIAWVEERLGHVRRRVVGPVEQIRLWQRCCLLRVPTDQGATFLKAVSGPFSLEPALTRELSRLLPGRVPQVLGADEGRGLLLTADFGGATLDNSDEIAVWEKVAQEYAWLQIACAQQTDPWLAAGCPDRSLSVLTEQICCLLADLHKGDYGLSSAQAARFQSLGPNLTVACEKLAVVGLPATLSHGDLCAGNVVVTASGPLFFDWSDASLSHPFFDLFWLLHSVEARFPNSPEVRQRLQEAYLEPWTSFAPKERLREAYALSLPLAAMHHAFTYVHYLLPNVEVNWEMADLVPFFLGEALAIYEA